MFQHSAARIHTPDRFPRTADPRRGLLRAVPAVADLADRRPVGPAG